MRTKVPIKISKFVLISGLIGFFLLFTLITITPAQITPPHTIPTPSVTPQTPPITPQTPPTTIPTPSVTPQTPPVIPTNTTVSVNYIFAQIFNFFNGFFGWSPVATPPVTPAPVPTPRVQ